MAKGSSVSAAVTHCQESPVNTGVPVQVWPEVGQALRRVLAVQTKLHQWAMAEPGRRLSNCQDLWMEIV
jgi:hypothetical protein